VAGSRSLVPAEGTGTRVLHFVILVICAVAIYISCEWFVNAVEWLGQRLNVGTTAVGTILAAFGTALPESVVTFVAVVFGRGEAAKDIGVGAAMGGPLALATVAYGVTGLVMWSQRRARVRVPAGGPLPEGPASDLGDTRKLARDQTWFLVIFVVKVALGLVAFAIKPWLGLLFFAAYAVYFWRELRADDDAHEHDLEPLKLQRKRATPATWAVVLQTLITLGVIFVASQLFVHQLGVIGPMIGLPAAVTAVLLSPIATELPETMNAIIWVRQGKTRLALANISGAMMIQATVPSGLGLLFTPWRFDHALLVSGLVTMGAIVYLLVLLRMGRLNARTLTAAAGFYAVFAVSLFFVDL
jgi:cation:H+ antiporter